MQNPVKWQTEAFIDNINCKRIYIHLLTKHRSALTETEMARKWKERRSCKERNLENNLRLKTKINYREIYLYLCCVFFTCVPVL